MQLIAACLAGLEAVVTRELRELGADDVATRSTGRVAFTGDWAMLAAANLWLRAADRVLVEVDRFEARDFEQLFERTRRLPWEQWIGENHAFPVSGRSTRSTLASVPACQRTVKKAIALRLGEATGRAKLPETGPRVAFEIALLHDEATLLLDSSGDGLHKRGYRDLTGAAPLRETLAAGLVLLSHWTPDRPLIDPFCGSGTIPIEAAMIGRSLAPGLRRRFDAEAWACTPPDVWDAARRDAEAKAGPGLPERIIATDRDEAALALARRHAVRAGVEADIHFQRAEFAELRSSRRHGCVITNPPYGHRLDSDAEVAALYASMPHVFRGLPTWSFFVLTGRPGFEQLVGREATRRRKLYNAQLACTYYQFHGPKPGSPHPDQALEAAPAPPTATPSNAAAPEVAWTTGVSPAGAPAAAGKPPTPQVFGGVSAKGRQQAELLANRLRKRQRHFRRWPARRRVTCFRLYERDIPEIPLVIDRYEDHLHVAEYPRPHDRSPAEHADWLDLMLATASRTLEIPRKAVFLKHRGRQRGASQYEKTAHAGSTTVVQERGLKFEVNLSDYIDTGLFLDHRETRRMFAGDAPGRRVLNLFCYTGAFTVYAAAANAESTLSVDTSSTYLDWAQRNLELNGLDAPRHRGLRADAMTFLEDVEPGAFDLAIVDPPTFSNSKSNETIWDVQADHAKLLTTLMARLARPGRVYFSTNARRFELDAATLTDAGVRVHEITAQTHPEDFRRQPHRCWVLDLGDFPKSASASSPGPTVG